MRDKIEKGKQRQPEIDSWSNSKLTLARRVSGELVQPNKREPAAVSPAHHYTLPAQTAIIRE